MVTEAWGKPSATTTYAQPGGTSQGRVGESDPARHPTKIFPTPTSVCLMRLATGNG